jgi:hypothetical protein
MLLLLTFDRREIFGKKPQVFAVLVRTGFGGKKLSLGEHPLACGPPGDLVIAVMVERIYPLRKRNRAAEHRCCHPPTDGGWRYLRDRNGSGEHELCCTQPEMPDP